MLKRNFKDTHTFENLLLLQFLFGKKIKRKHHIHSQTFTHVDTYSNNYNNDGNAFYLHIQTETLLQIHSVTWRIWMYLPPLTPRCRVEKPKKIVAENENL